MSIYAHIIGGQVAEPLFTPPEGVAIADCFHPALLWVDVSDVSPAPETGWTATESNGVWHFAPPVPPVVDIRPAARAALVASDSVVVSCLEQGQALPGGWAAYRGALRAIMGGTDPDATLPAEPAAPSGI